MRSVVSRGRGTLGPSQEADGSHALPGEVASEPTLTRPQKVGPFLRTFRLFTCEGPAATLLLAVVPRTPGPSATLVPLAAFAFRRAATRT